MNQTRLEPVYPGDLKVGDLFARKSDLLPVNVVELIGRDYLVFRTPSGQPALAAINDGPYYVEVPNQIIDWSKVEAGTTVMVREAEVDSWKSGHFGGRSGEKFIVGGAIWSQCKLPYSDDWIFRRGGNQPIPAGVMVEMWLREDTEPRTDGEEEATAYDASRIRWSWDEAAPETDVIAYRIVGELAPGYRWY